MGERTPGVVRRTTPARARAFGPPSDRRGVPSAGQIVTLFIGQSYGFIREANGREVFFHRSDVRDGTSFNDFSPGDPVRFERLDDAVSGPRALRVERRRPRR
jgi:cold shock CspA family protein